MSNIQVEDLFEAGVHLGHQVRRWNPKFNFVYDHRNGVSLIDLEQTLDCLNKAYEFLEGLVATGQDILFVGTKPQAQEVIRESGNTTQMPFCASRWLGGCLTNFETIKRSLEKYKRFISLERDGSLAKFPKKEAAVIRREMSRMHRNFEGMVEVKKLPAALVVIDTKSEHIAVQEANRLGIPVVAIIDTNSDPSLVQYPIPGNDDAIKSIRFLMDQVIEAIQAGLSQRTTEKAKPFGNIKPIKKEENDASEESAEVTMSDDIKKDLEKEAKAKKGSTESDK